MTFSYPARSGCALAGATRAAVLAQVGGWCRP